MGSSIEKCAYNFAHVRMGDGEAEVRRFPVDESAATNFDYLTEKVRQYFPQLSRKSFKLYWKGECMLYDGTYGIIR